MAEVVIFLTIWYYIDRIYDSGQYSFLSTMITTTVTTSYRPRPGKLQRSLSHQPLTLHT